MDNRSIRSQTQSQYAASISENALVYSNYNRNYRAVGVMWGVFTICFAIINIVVFLQPQWIGDTEDSVGTGYFGLYKWCELFSGGGISMMCKGVIGDFEAILSDAFIASTFFVGFSAILVLITICCCILFPFVKNPSVVFMICGWIQVIAGLCMFLGCIVYPLGWDNEEIARICGDSASQFNLGTCGIRWAYILAIIGIFDAFILAILAFVLATKYIPKPQLGAYQAKSDMNGYITDADSAKPSVMIQPVMTVPGERMNDGYSEYSAHSTGKRSKRDFKL